MDLISNALTFAVNAHQGQQRKHNRMPYIIHPLDVFNKLREVGISDEYVLAASLLHDVVEDCEVKESLILDIFGSKVCQYVMECTKTEKNHAGENRQEKWECYLQHLANYSKQGVVIKLADRCCNLKEFLWDWDILSDEQKYFLTKVYYKESEALVRGIKLIDYADVYDRAKATLSSYIDAILYEIDLRK